MRNRWLIAVLLLLTALPGFAQAGNPNKRAAMKPNLDLYVYRRCYMPQEQIQINFSGFNVAAAQFAAYRFNLNSVVKTSRSLVNFGAAIKSLDLQGHAPAAVWRYSMGKTFSDQWTQRGVKVPKLPPGTYVIQARAGGVEKRTWLAVTQVALVAKRSRQELLLFAADAGSGKPFPHLPLSVTDARGQHKNARTDADGVLRIPTSWAQGNLWVLGDSTLGPVFALSGEPAAPDPYAVYTVTDRPLYRPGNLVHYHAIVRQRVEADAPGGFEYRPYARRPVIVEVRDATDALVSRQTVISNAYGSVNGDFLLASEPTLGNWHLNICIGDFCSYGGFIVQEYRKPEMRVSVAFPETHYLGGTTVPVTVDAHYYFGSPVTHSVVQYQVSFNGENTETDFQGRGITDAQGQFHLNIPTQRLPTDRTLAVHATVTDLSRRSQSTDGNTLLTAGLFSLTLGTNKPIYKTGARITVLVHATDYDNKPVAAKVTVRMIETKEDRQHRVYQETTTRQITTDAKGQGSAFFSSPRPGNLSFEAEAFDAQDDKITAQTEVTVTDEKELLQTEPTLSLTSAQPAYHPGQVATVMLDTTLVGRPFVPATANTPAQPAHPNAWALVTVEGERLGQSQVILLTQRHTVLHVPLSAEDFPSISVNVAIIEDRQIYEQQQRLSVIQNTQKLNVAVTSDKAAYQPGQTATYTVTTRNAQGQPVPAEVSLGVVDASIYALQPDDTPAMGAFFYGGQEVRVQTDFSFAAQYSGGGYQNVPDMAGNPGGGGQGIRVRQHFADTAFWNPALDTGANGTATVQFLIPDNVTTWRATAHAVTEATAVGSATQEAVSTMPLLVRLELPRFYVQNDQTVVSAIVQNGTKRPETVQVRVQATGMALTGDTTRTLHLASGDQVRLDWPATVIGPGQAQIKVIADGGPGAQDATETELPVIPDGLKVVTASATTLHAGNVTDKIALSSLPAGASLVLTLSPSLVSALSGALDALATAPSGNTEETVAAFLPDIAVSRADHAVRPGLARDVSLGLQKLYRYQHPDGGWNWWEFDQTDGDMTAYALSALLEAQKAGYAVDPVRVARGVQALKRMLSQQQDLGAQADWGLVLAEAGEADVRKTLVALFAKRGHLDIYGQASLDLALAALGSVHDQTLAHALATRLAAEAVVQGRSVHWAAVPGESSWRSDDVTVTAHALRALLATDPGSPLIEGAVRWLMANRVGPTWDSTRASAEAIFALAAFLAAQPQGLAQTGWTAHVLLDGQRLQTVAATGQAPFAAPTTVALTASELQGHSTVTVEKQGPGVLYVSQVVTAILPPDQAKAQSSGITVSRQFRLYADDPSHAQTIASGSEMDVQLDLTADADYRYVRVAAPIPAGCEVDADAGGDGDFPTDFSDGDVGYTRQEVWDDQVVFFFDTLPKGLTRLTYRLTAETPGVYRILPSIADLVYFPEVRGNSDLVQTKIGDRP